MFLAKTFDLVGFVLKWWGDGSDKAKDAIEKIVVRSTENFSWVFIFALAVVFYVYWTEIKNKNFEAVQAGLALYGVHWLYEIMNAIIGKISGYPLWAVSNDSTSFILLVGVSWELSMMFALAGIISYKMIGDDPNKKVLKIGKFNGISMKLFSAISMSLLFALFESFLAATNGGDTFIWVYKWWGVIPVFITTYVPFFLASNYVPFMEPKKKKWFLIIEWGLVALLLLILIPCGVI